MAHAAFPNLLRSALHTCNRAGKPLAIGVAIVAGISIVMTIFLWGAALRAGFSELSGLLGPETAERVQRQMMMGPGPHMQQVMRDVGQQLSVTFKGMTEEEQRRILIPAFARFFESVMPMAGSFMVLSAILWLWGRTYFLILGMRGKGTFGHLALEAFAWMLPMLGVWLLTVLALIAWIPVAAIIGVALPQEMRFLVPILVLVGIVYAVYAWGKLALAPAILVGDRKGVIESMRRSFRATRGHWLRVFGNLIGAAAMVWIVTYVIQLVLSMLIQAAGSLPPLLILSSLAMMLVGVVGAAYKAVFLVKLKEAVVHH